MTSDSMLIRIETGSRVHQTYSCPIFLRALMRHRLESMRKVIRVIFRGYRLLGNGCACSALVLGVLTACTATPIKKLDLSGYADASGAITLQRYGSTVDPYFTLQALWLAKKQGMDISKYALPWAQWMAHGYTAMGHLGRYCRVNGPWQWCKEPDADDASLALWLQFLSDLPAKDKVSLQTSELQARARQDLNQLKNPQTGVYRISAHQANSLFMDNLEIWATQPHENLARAISANFWDPVHKRFRVTTQADHAYPAHHFYPDAAAQIYPLLVGYPNVPGGARTHYRQWIKTHRKHWLSQTGNEFPWGVIAIVAWQQGDDLTVRCWQQAALPFRHSYFWTVTDEVVAQLLPPLTSPFPNQKDCT